MRLCDTFRYTPELKDRIADALHAFTSLVNDCPYAYTKDADCHHPDQDFNHMTCSPANCPWLL